LEQARAGVDPVAERRAIATKAAANTVEAAVNKYLAQNRTKFGTPFKPTTAREWRRIFEHDVLPRWRDRPIASITKGDVLELIHDKARGRERKRAGSTGGAAVHAGKVLARLHTFFGWAAAHDLVSADPTAGVMRPAKEGQRDRVLTDDEIRHFWKTTGEIGQPFGNLFRLLLLTGQRLSEVAGLCWSELRDDATWEIPAVRSKNGKAHIVHLSALAMEVLQSVPRIDGHDLLFARRDKKTPPTGFSHAKGRVDVRMATLTDKPIPPWTLHDLRRTATSGMARLGIPPHVADRILNHQAGTIRGVAAVYNRYTYLPERQTALEAWGRYVESLIRPTPSNVSQIRAA
jgi:integrase